MSESSATGKEGREGKGKKKGKGREGKCRASFFPPFFGFFENTLFYVIIVLFFVFFFFLALARQKPMKEIEPDVSIPKRYRYLTSS